MSNNYIQTLFAERIGGSRFGKETVLYKFEKIKRAKRQAMGNNPGIELIDLGVGEPDWGADEAVVDVLRIEAGKPENRGYTDNGIEVFKEAAAKYLEKVYDVRDIDPSCEVTHGIGSKPILALLPLAFINPGDIAILTVPGYPVLGTMTEALMGNVVKLPLLEENGFLPDLDSLSAEQRRRAKLLYLNYPNNPTGATATKAFYEKVVDFAHQNQIIVVADAAYAGLTFDGEPPLSILSINGAKEVAVEIHSHSKSFNMTGWRLAFLAGNELVVKGFAAVKDNNDSGQFAAIQKAGVYCLEHPEISARTAAKYSRRHELLVAALRRVGFSVRKPKASFYLYAKIPKGTAAGVVFSSAEVFSEFLTTRSLISTVPWDDVGHYIRFSVTFVAGDEAEERRIVGEIERRLQELELVF
ncbi:LL-diaminopimelate aminotransferase [Geomonas subterranea]|uniref:LL-diaminopimelate aminotransferase n=1 Tax=Geomonas subterranea TaxID=2847989 RepID=A0ABX8LMT2_9BACT|nr:LL-diaminopimelate aminotransferase [Geomonas subterranea]QXE92636.1 LL-diaminopimelate aminotransferase [Geomonas subterranea]QXM09265.1 LL-diaminopimelate aminotransferase [Geomonas subterranea]